MAAVGQTITIVNKSGKIVSTSKHLINIFNEAKTTYNERKAELKAQRQNGQVPKEPRTRTQLEALSLADDDDIRSRRSSRQGSPDGNRYRHPDDHRLRRKPVPTAQTTASRRRPPVERGVSDSFYANDRQQPEHIHHDDASLIYGRDDDPRIGELTRRYTDTVDIHRRSPPNRRNSLDDLDMSLAYGALPPPLPPRHYNDEVELRNKMSGLQRLLDEAHCLQHTALALIDTLQKNPDKLAAVALTLAEISSLASKMAPGALAGLKGSFPAIIALLASPEFAIAVGVGVGVTVIALGGWKIVKKIKARNEAARLEMGFEVGGGDARALEEPESPVDEAEELREISRIESWRRGIEVADVEDMGSSVEGEFLTPRATNTLIGEGRLREQDLKPAGSSSSRKDRKKRTAATRTNAASETKGHAKSGGAKPKAKRQPSGLRLLFTGSSK